MYSSKRDREKIKSKERREEREPGKEGRERAESGRYEERRRRRRRRMASTNASRDTSVLVEGYPNAGSNGTRDEARKISNAGESERRERKRRGRSWKVRRPPPRHTNQ